MPRACNGWLWAKCIRDHGPRSSSVRLVLFGIRTRIGEDSPYPFASQKTIAKDCACSDKTVQRALRQAEQEGWIVITERGAGKGWRQYAYRPCIPDWVPLSDKDEEIVNALEASEGEPEPRLRADTQGAPSTNRADTQGAASDSRGTSDGMVRTSNSDGADSEGASCGLSGQMVPPQSRTKFSSEKSLRQVSSEEARVADATTSTPPDFDFKTPKLSERKPKAEDPEARAVRIRKTIARWPDYDEYAIAKLAGVTSAEVIAIRQELAAEPQRARA